LPEMRVEIEMRSRQIIEWLALLVCAGSFLMYLFHSLAVAKYMRMYLTLLSKVTRIFAG